MNKITSILVLLIFASFTLQGQLYIYPTQEEPAEEYLATTLVGPQVTINNPNLICSDMAHGTFTTNDIEEGFDLSYGIVMSTGSIDDVMGPSSGITSTNLDTEGDDMLTQYAQVATQDACILEFDVTTFGNEFLFNFVFGSEEYDSYVCSQFNDAFAFFVSGPAPDGTMYENLNIALIPDTDIPISISTINDGIADGNGGPVCILDYSQYYIDVIPELEFEGLTTTLIANVDIIPFETYHLKLVIADGVDSALDSGVFIEGGSLRGKPLITVESEEDIEIPNSNVLAEGCKTKIFSINLEEIENDCTLHLQIDGTATNGVDYTDIDGNPLPTEILFTPDNLSKTLEIVPVVDEDIEILETIIISIVGIDGTISADEALFIKLDTLTLLENLLNYAHIEVISFESNPSGGTAQVQAFGGDTYEWFPASLVSDVTIYNPVIEVLPDVEYGCIISNGSCSETFYLTIPIDTTTMPIDTMDIDTTTMPMDTTNTALSYIPKDYIQIYPNPFSDIINITAPLPTNSKIRLYDNTGQLVSTQITQNQLNLSTLPKGLYIIVININGTDHYEKIIKH